MSARLTEVNTVNTRILSCTLVVDDARAFWAVPDLGPPEGRADRAVSAYWFGARSHARAELLLANMRVRYEAWPSALAVLRTWPDMDPDTRALVCHWHQQLADPIYRRFTGELLPRRRAEGRWEIGRAPILAWVIEQDEARGAAQPWTTVTRMAFASKLLSAASEAGLVGPGREPRPLRLPRVPDLALGYLLHLLREVDIAGSLLDNPYLASVGLVGEALRSRLMGVPGLRCAQQGDLLDLQWQHDGLRSWFDAVRARTA